MIEQEREHDQRVGPLELFFDLVAAVFVALQGYELIWWREARAQTRAPLPPASAS